MEELTPEEAERERLRKRLEEMRRDPVQMRVHNAAMAKIASRRIRQGFDTLEKLQTRVANICARPETEQHTAWNARNLLEQTEALLAEDSTPLPPPEYMTPEQPKEMIDAYISGDRTRIEAVKAKDGVGDA